MKQKDRFYPIEAALLLALSLTLLTGVLAQARQRSLSQKLVRLHVIAASDTAEDQAVKLRVRDAILAAVSPELEGVSDEAEALAVLKEALPLIARTAREVSGEHVTVTLGQETYPTRVYDTFSLPAGSYASLRVVLGEGRGHNWWCVVYPPLCTAAVTEEVQSVSGLERQDVRLITGDGDGYVLRFRVIELWETLFSALETETS